MTRPTILDAAAPIHAAQTRLVLAFDADDDDRCRTHLIVTGERLRDALRLVDGQLQALRTKRRRRRAA